MNPVACVTLGLMLLVPTGVTADDQWPQFRGPQAGAVADDPDLRQRFEREAPS